MMLNLKFKASYRPQHVPLVSLMSKLNGKAIIGHPLTVEALEDGYCDEVLNGVGYDLAAADVYCVAKASSLTRRSPSKNMALQSCISSEAIGALHLHRCNRTIMHDNMWLRQTRTTNQILKLGLNISEDDVATRGAEIQKK